jgi:uncharacterized protein (DUF58 family)
MDRDELFQAVRRLHLQASRQVSGQMSGAYRSQFKGRGMEFLDNREYVEGDDIRTIDWNVTARCGEPFIKRFQEERELNVVCAVDISASALFGTSGGSKRAFAAEVMALLAYTGLQNQDRVGLALLSDHLESWVAPSRGLRHSERMIRDVLAYEAASTGTDLGRALQELSTHLPSGTVLFVISDFHDEGYEARLRVLGRRHDVVAVILEDPRERELPSMGPIRFRDPETGRSVRVNTSRRRVRRRFRELAEARRAELHRRLLREGVGVLPIGMETPAYKEVVRYFEKRRSRG